MKREQILKSLREQIDAANARGDYAEALILNDRVRDLKEGSGLAVERAMQVFESGLARRRAYWCRADLTCGCGACQSNWKERFNDT
jgi:hypothetical protein